MAKVQRKERGLTVIFGRQESLGNPILENTVLIVPSQDGWNDFGYRIKVDVRVRLVGEKQDYEAVGYIGFITNSQEGSNGANRLKEIVESAESMEFAASDSHKFYTMLPSMEAYRKIVKALGADRAAEVLVAMRDLVALKELKSSANWLSSAENSNVFQKAFIRRSESYYAYNNAGAIIKGLEFERFGNISRAISVNFRLAGWSNAHNLVFRFDHDADLPKRMAVIIGKNGVGKSQTLGRIVRSALNGGRSVSDENTGGRILVNRILAFAPTNEAGSVFPRDQLKRPLVWYRRFSLNRSQARSKGGISGQVIQVARSDEYIGKNSRWDIFRKALEAIDNWEQICLPGKKGGLPPLLLKDMQHGGEEKILEKFSAVDGRKDPLRLISGRRHPLSSGEISFLKFAAQVSLSIENGSLLLLDEPETHLHPNFISQFVSLLDILLDLTGSVAIIATHSAYFVREVFSEQVTVMRREEDGYIRAEHPILKTFGADVGAISYFVFGEDEPSRLAAAVGKRLRNRFESWEELYASYKNELSMEMLGSIKESMSKGGG